MDSCEFSFDGHHISEYGATYLISRWPGAAGAAANTAAIGGRHGTLRYPGETYAEKRLTGKLYLLDAQDELLTYAQMIQRIEEIAGWLKPGGRRRLMLDAAPERFYMAEVLDEIAFTTDDWPNGCAEVTFVLQPFAYDEQESAASFTLAANAAQVKTIAVPGNMPAPLLMRLTATEAVNAAELSEGGRTLRLEGLGLGAGGVVEIGAPLENGEIMTCKAHGANAMSKITAASAVPFELAPGLRNLTVKADGACTVRAAARGRWK